MHSALVSIGRDADILEFLSFGPQVSPQGQEERQGPKGSVDLNQQVCLDDTGQLQYLLNRHDVVVHFVLL